MNHDLSLMEISQELKRQGCGIVVRRPPPPKKAIPQPAHCRSEEAWAAIRAVSERTGVTFEAMRSPCMTEKVRSARKEAMRAVADAVGWVPTPGNCKKATYWTAVTIGDLFGRKYSTVLHALGRLARNKKSEAGNTVVLTERGRGEP